jgi:hypothetical protein
MTGPDAAFLEKSSASHQALVDPERPRIGWVKTALVIDHELGNAVGRLMLGDLGSLTGRAIATAVWDVPEVMTFDHVCSGWCARGRLRSHHLRFIMTRADGVQRTKTESS